MARTLFTSESVSMGHPDKLADQIADGGLDAFMARDPACRVACEVLIKSGFVVVAGEVTSTGYVDIPTCVREINLDVGYADARTGMECVSCGQDIAQGVSEGTGLYKEQGAGDQGLMFGFACDETPELMPLPITLAHRLVARHAQVRFSGELDFLRPDAKSQVTVEYADGRPVRVDAILLSTQHAPDISHEQIKEDVTEAILRPTIPSELWDDETRVFVNPTGRFVVGGPAADAGLTGRKIIVDTYGGMGRHGGGSFSGKDPSKVDRSAAYASRWVAKNLVAAGAARRLELQVSYAIGVSEPISILVDAFGTGKVSEDAIIRAVRKRFDLTPKAIIDSLNLLRPIYRQTACHGHFGRSEPEFTWEKTDKAEDLRRDLGL